MSNAWICWKNRLIQYMNTFSFPENQIHGLPRVPSNHSRDTEHTQEEWVSQKYKYWFIAGIKAAMWDKSNQIATVTKVWLQEPRYIFKSAQVTGLWRPTSCSHRGFIRNIWNTVCKQEEKVETSVQQELEVEWHSLEWLPSAVQPGKYWCRHPDFEILNSLCSESRSKS